MISRRGESVLVASKDTGLVIMGAQNCLFTNHRKLLAGETKGLPSATFQRLLVKIVLKDGLSKQSNASHAQ